ncbi:MAG TPA: acyl-CoA dehydrogenase family protein [Baekduia sp.]|uniref:acyl-CoA dehydrogenase family protein n=1 Tax=Baekduia sp. TaxID=2600305 RepID=UPI002D796270|nr:acyl-CoA dehydrogenase family protein [Baekduia sp.]HET6507926.1 acyl-CoA dehydrogenase family protein [Baekduia sp.]
MDWTGIPDDVASLLRDIDAFIDDKLAPIEAANPEYFDHRREFTRTDVERGGIPTQRWRELLFEARRLSIEAGFYRYPFPEALGGQDGSNLAMAIVREHLAHRGPGLHAELSHEASVVANEPLALVLHEYGTAEQKAEYLEPLINGETYLAFGLTEPGHGSDATWLETTARRDGDDWIIDGAKRFNSVIDVAVANIVFARTSGQPGKADGITAFIVPRDAPGMTVPYYHWCFNMPTDHAETLLEGVRVPSSAILGQEGRGLDCAQLFVHENRIRQAASSLGAAQFCIDRSVAYASERLIFNRPLADYQGIQWQLVELQTDAELLRNTIRKTAWEMDQAGDGSSTEAKVAVTDKVSMVNYRGNQLACRAADRAIQVHGGVGYTRHVPFEHIYRHHRRYRITEGSDELQMRRIASKMFDFKDLKAKADEAAAARGVSAAR